MLGALASAAAAAGFAACLSLFGLSTTLSAAPVGIEAGADRLEATLAQADWRSPGDGPVIYLATSPDCSECNAYTARALTELRRDGYDVRVLALMPGGAGPRHRVLRDVVAENGGVLRLPAVFWRARNRWVAAFGDDVDVRARVRADLGPET